MEFIKDLIFEYGLAAMFVIILLEYACFPVSSEIVLPFSGAVACANKTPFPVILILSVIAGLIGTGICYLIGWFGGSALISTIKRKYPKTEKAINASYEKFEKNGAPAVCIGRVIPLVRTYISLVAGSARLNPASYFPATFLGITVWNTILIGLGYTLRDNYDRAAIIYQRYKYNLIPVFIIAAAFLTASLIRKRCLRKKDKTPLPE
jgi:membrane protein DedA with SNARE-associated domain